MSLTRFFKILIFIFPLLITCTLADFRIVDINKKITVNLKNKVMIEYHFEKIYYEKKSNYTFFRLIVTEIFNGTEFKIYNNSLFKIKINGKDAFLTLDENGTSEPISSTWRCMILKESSKFVRKYAVHNLEEFSDFYSLSHDKFTFEILDSGYRFSKNEITKKDLENGFEDCSN